MGQDARWTWWGRMAVPAVVLGVALWGWSWASSERPSSPRGESLAGSFLQTLDSPAGFCVHLGATDGDLTTALSQNGKHLVHALVNEEAVVEAIRRRTEAANLAGIVSVQKGSAGELPYADNLVSLLVAEDLPRLTKEGLLLAEVQRVLRPGGVAWLGGASPTTSTKRDRESLEWLLHDAGIEDFELIEQEGLWAKVVVPRKETIDEWTHKRYDASGNPVSKDTEVGVPTGVRWMAGPLWPTGYRKSAVPAVVANENQMVYLFQDEVKTADGIEPQDSLIARDAHNGLLQWKGQATKQSAALALVDDRVYAVVEDGGPLVALDVRSGEVLTTYDGTARPKQVLVIDDRVLVQARDGLTAYDAASGESR